MQTTKEVAAAFVEFYENLLGTDKKDKSHVVSTLVQAGPMVSEEQKAQMTKRITMQEIKEALWGIEGTKAPGPDRYGSQFFKESWSIVGKVVTEAVLEFFQSGKMLRAMNTTTITLIPKSTHASTVGDYRPIACCNVVYKIISKMLCNRLKLVLPGIISQNQSACVVGRTIVQNILICQDLVRLHNRKNTTKNCLIKVDLKKAYDSIEWEFVREMLHVLNFPAKFIGWIMQGDPI